MSDMLNTKTNEYQQRIYPQDTPKEAAARLEGFENGRQYEASLRDDTPAALIPAAEFAALNPKVVEDGIKICYFCRSCGWGHLPECLWVRCGGKPFDSERYRKD